MPPPLARASMLARWRIMAAAAAVLLALVVAPMLYVGQRPSVEIGNPPAAVPQPPPPPSPTSVREREVTLSIRAADGSRVPALTIQLFRGDSQVPDVIATTDPSGTATLKGLSPGSYRAVIATGDRRVAETRVDIASGPDDQQLQVTLPPDVRFSRRR